MPTGGLPSCALSAPAIARTFAFESDVPRPKSAPFLSVGSNGAETHLDSSPGGTTS
jgi:hypothetical protein